MRVDCPIEAKQGRSSRHIQVPLGEKENEHALAFLHKHHYLEPVIAKRISGTDVCR